MWLVRATVSMGETVLELCLKVRVGGDGVAGEAKTDALIILKRKINRQKH